MADRIQQEALSVSGQPDQRHQEEEPDQAAPNHQKKISDQVEAQTKQEDPPDLARPKASACPPQSEPTATTRQASQETQPQPPPSQFLNPEDQKTREEQRPDPAKTAKPPVPPGDLRAKECLNLLAHVRMRLPKSSDLNTIHFSALPCKWQLPAIFNCIVNDAQEPAIIDIAKQIVLNRRG